jgi:hypothetical protein
MGGAQENHGLLTQNAQQQSMGLATAPASVPLPAPAPASRSAPTAATPGPAVMPTVVPALGCALAEPEARAGPGRVQGGAGNRSLS